MANKPYIGRKPSHGAGRTKKKRCIAKRHGSKCPCGSYGKKLDYIPYPFHDDAVFLQRTAKWRKKRGIEIIEKAKLLY